MSEGKMFLLGIAAMIVTLLGLVWFCAVQESRTYNRLTGADTTAMDALWVELRVEGQPE